MFYNMICEANKIRPSVILHRDFKEIFQGMLVSLVACQPSYYDIGFTRCYCYCVAAVLSFQGPKYRKFDVAFFEMSVGVFPHTPPHKKLIVISWY